MREYLKYAIILAISVILFSCDEPMSVVRVKLTLPSDVSKVCIAVFNGEPLVENLLSASEYYSKDVTVDVPTGENRYFLVLAVDSSNLAQEIGIAGPYSITTTSNDINIQLTRLTDSTGDVLAFTYSQITQIGRWRNAGASLYEVEAQDSVGYPWIKIYSGTQNYCHVNIMNNFHVRCTYSYFSGVVSVWSYYKNAY